jgi:hypothetical protein
VYVYICSRSQSGAGVGSKARDTNFMEIEARAKINSFGSTTLHKMMLIEPNRTENFVQLSWIF